MEGEKRSVCVTGAGGYLASWLVKLLLSKGFKVHGTVRDPNSEKNSHLKKLENASENLRLFKADLYDYDGLLAAVSGCDGVFHVASPIPAIEVADPEVEVIAPAIAGTINALKACKEANVRRVVVVSSVSAIMVNPSWPKGKPKNEDCWSDPGFCRMIENWYFVSKTMSERAAWEYAEENGLDLITVCPAMTFGPLLQPTVNASSFFLLDIIKGGQKPIENMTCQFVDVRDVAEALFLVYDKPEASGRYLCGPHASTISDLVDTIKAMYPYYPYTELVDADQDVPMSSEKLTSLGWSYKPLKETLVETIENFQELGILEKN